MTLAEYLQQTGLSQAKFARLVGASQIAVSRWSRGESLPRRGMHMRILHATGGRVTPNDFVLASGVNHTAADLSRENNVNPIGAGVQASNSASGAVRVENVVARTASPSQTTVDGAPASTRQPLPRP